MKRLGEHAVVIGASVGGMLAARALSEAYETVTVLDRDSLPARDLPRRAVPQGRHPHVLIAGGQEAIEGLLPGIGDEMIQDGAPTCALTTDVRFSVLGSQLARVGLDVTAVTASRPFVEGHIRRRVCALPNVFLRDRCEVRGLVTDSGGERVTGVELDAEETVRADLVVAATGRSARVPAWLEELGYGRPPETTIRLDVAYATRAYRLQPDALADKVVFIGPRPGFPRLMGLFAQEEGRWLLALGGYGEDRPPSEDDAYDAFLETVAPPDVMEALRDGERLGGIESYGYRAGRRWRYEKMRRFPERLLVLGDAICSFNPFYGQGMTVAAFESLALRSCLEKGHRRLRRRYLRAAAGIVDHAWEMAVSSDLALPEVAGPRPLAVRLGNAYAARLRERIGEDGELTAGFARVVAMLDRPGALMRPSIARRVLARPRSGSLVWPARPLSMPVRRRTVHADGVATPLREAGPAEAREAVVFVHGNPGSGADFEPLVSAAGKFGRAVAWDAPGFGRAGAPEGFEQTVEGHASFIDRVLEGLGIERAHLVLHDFGGPWGLAWGAQRPERLASATLIDTGVPLGYRWHRMARVWRTPLAGELAMAAMNRRGFGYLLRRGQSRRLPGPFVDRMYREFDRGTRRAVLDLYRSADMAAEAERLAQTLRPLDVPALVVWGADDPYVPAALAERQREAFPTAEVHVLEDSGHWPFIDQADRVEGLLLDFLGRVFEAKAAGAGAVRV